MSKLGYIQNSYGKPFSISVANTYSFNVMAASKSLPKNTLIISSNVDDNGYDTGSYSLIVTDYEGNPVRLTYSISEGNGLHYSSDSDSLSLSIDNDTIIYDRENGLTINLNNHLDNSLVVDSGSITLDLSKFPLASDTNYGISYIDGYTIKSDDGMIYIDTSALMYSNNSTDTYGIAIGDGETIYSDNGRLSVNISSLKKADDNGFGISKGDEYTVHTIDGILSVDTSNLDKATSITFGISKISDNTLMFDSENNITVNEKNLSISSPDKYGISAIDSRTLDVTDGVVSVKQYNNIFSKINLHEGIFSEYKKKLDDYINYLSSGNVLLKNKNILLFAINETSAVELNKPLFDEEVVNMPLQTVTAVFDVITTCDFILNIDFKEGTNEFPLVDVFEVNYNDEKSYTKVEALDPKTIFPSTSGKLKKFIIKFSAKNFRNTVKLSHIITDVNIQISSADDHNKYLSQKFSILRYNSAYNEERSSSVLEEYFVLMNDSVYWDYVD